MSGGVVWEPRPYQIEVLKFLLSNSNAGLLLDPGLGKTACVLAALCVLKKQRMFKRALVVAPKRVARHVWPAEREKWLDFWNLPMHVLHGGKKDALLNTLPPGNIDNPDVCVVTFDGLEWLARDNGHRFTRLGADVLVVDESTYIRHTNTRRFKNLRPFLHTFKRRMILTGTPIPKSYEDLFGQIFVLDLGNSLGRFITHYRTTYFDNVGYEHPDWRLRAGSAEKINDKIRPMVLRGDKDDYLKLPTLLHNDVSVVLPPSARSAYKELEAKFYLALDSGEEISSPTAAALANKLRQVSNGFAYAADKSVVLLHDEKLNALHELVMSLQGKPALVAYEYVADVSRIEKELGYPAGTLPVMGSGTDKDDALLIKRFNAGELPVLCVHPQSAGHGLNLQESAGHVIWFGPTWNLELYDQLIARVHRSGNPNEHVTVHTIVGCDTVDERVVQVLQGKDRTQRALLSAMKARR
jgi:SNF2 family DNA or RNA helicase